MVDANKMTYKNFCEFLVYSRQRIYVCQQRPFYFRDRYWDLLAKMHSRYPILGQPVEETVQLESVYLIKKREINLRERDREREKHRETVSVRDGKRKREYFHVSINLSLKFRVLRCILLECGEGSSNRSDTPSGK